MTAAEASTMTDDTLGPHLAPQPFTTAADLEEQHAQELLGLAPEVGGAGSIESEVEFMMGRSRR